MKFNLKDFIQLDTDGLLAVNGGSDCGGTTSKPSSTKSEPSGGSTGDPGNSGGNSGNNDPDSSTTNPFKYNYGGLHLKGGGTCGGRDKKGDDTKKETSEPGNSNPPSDIPDNKPEEPPVNTEEPGLAKVANDLAYPVGEEYSTDYVVTSVFGPRDPMTINNTETNPLHSGIDIAAPEGTRINSVGVGVVSEVGSNGSLGNYIVVTHPNGSHTRYAHCSQVYAGVGQAVAAGERIAAVGSTGMSTGSHLHFSYDGNGDGNYTDYKHDNPNNLLSR